MTKKRFYEINSQILGLTTIQDKNKQYTFPPLKTEKNHMFLKSLNELVLDCNILKKENEQLKQELAIYRKLANCSNCKYHNYDWYDDGDEFEVCEKGNDVTEGICKEWEELE